MLGPPPPAGVIDQDPPHGLRRRGEKVRAAVSVLRPVRAHQPQVRLMNQVCTLE
jgi:hypothetical protein